MVFHYSILHHSTFFESFMKDRKALASSLQSRRGGLADNPECATSSYNLGSPSCSKGIWTRPLTLQRGDPEQRRMFEAWVNLGYISSKRGSRTGRFCQQKAVEVEPRYARGYANLDSPICNWTDRRGDRGLKKPRAEPTCPGLEHLANAYLQKGDFDKAVETNLNLLKLARPLTLGTTPAVPNSQKRV